jgi:uncharacterized protein (DUF58 family)
VSAARAMASAPAPSSPPESGRRRADPRLTAYMVAGFGALVAAIATGQASLAALGAPFLALAAIGLLDREPTGFVGAVTLHTGRVIEGDIVEGEARVDWDGEAEVDVILTGCRAVTALEPAHLFAWSLRGKGPVTLPFRFRAELWGHHDMGALWIRSRRPGGLGIRERKVAPAPPLQVLPTPLRLGRLLKPAEPRAVAGMHVSRFRGHGTDFAELRPYRPGDRLRDLSWATSARLGSPWVTVRHSERTGTVLLLLDAVFSDERSSTEALARAARAAWAVASIHLRAQDRVGLLARGRSTAWLPPQGGRRARWLLLEELLAVGAAADDLRGRSRRTSRAVVPHDALIVAVTSLHSQLFAQNLLHYRRAGHTAVALVIDAEDLLPDADGHLDAAARRIWLAQRDAERYHLERGGIPTALVTTSQGVGPAISALRRRMSAYQPGRKAAFAR